MVKPILAARREFSRLNLSTSPWARARIISISGVFSSSRRSDSFSTSTRSVIWFLFYANELGYWPWFRSRSRSCRASVELVESPLGESGQIEPFWASRDGVRGKFSLSANSWSSRLKDIFSSRSRSNDSKHSSSCRSRTETQFRRRFSLSKRVVQTWTSSQGDYKSKSTGITILSIHYFKSIRVFLIQ